MITYLIKAIACLLILLLAHRLLLQREAMHRFNRFFLLFSVVVSFLIPLVIDHAIPPKQKGVSNITQVSNPSKIGRDAVKYVTVRDEVLFTMTFVLILISLSKLSVPLF